MKPGSTSGVISVSGGTQLGGVIAVMYFNGSSSHAGIGAVGVSAVGATYVKCGDLGGGMAEASGMPDCTGIVECTG
jgi:hypothetical protein